MSDEATTERLDHPTDPAPRVQVVSDPAKPSTVFPRGERGGRWPAVIAKIAQVSSKISFLERGETFEGKSARGGDFSFKYLSAEQVIMALRPHLQEVGLWPQISVVSTARLPGATSNGFLHQVGICITWHDTAGDGWVQTFTTGEGWDSQDKGQAKAWTSAVKASLRSTFMLPLVDDAEKVNADQIPATQAQHAAAQGLAQQAGYTQAEYESLIQSLNARDAQGSISAAGMQRVTESLQRIVRDNAAARQQTQSAARAAVEQAEHEAQMTAAIEQNVGPVSQASAPPTPPIRPTAPAPPPVSPQVQAEAVKEPPIGPVRAGPIYDAIKSKGKSLDHFRALCAQHRPAMSAHIAGDDYSAWPGEVYDSLYKWAQM